ncbi:hypothetical protein CWI42_091870 [Ordospora colligata]|uniref:Uncharacterized protein n=1 Tax=Ordospora colligata OC4 TaxID=1354746 RepID=A0A0B2UJ85_9MICR|nr:uncharacterized protein M896_091890 [Ordospora colligata OC4]KHN69259.1 hypothetical protein M896_091890 [Ordospora colligata OC4]TBU14437.1 hypothetical protein CWI40_091880 [Ordospora colligata]TBU14714.1 hypothetical protein CWI41_091890 [Ordospora colligata]TBU18099.1 hypothetical protein CWI42_091870 [Ordospora colligata]
MEELKLRVDELMKEVARLECEMTKKNEKIKKNRVLNMNLREEVLSKSKEIDDLNELVTSMKKQMENNDRRFMKMERMIKADCRRKELFNEKILGSVKSRGEYYISLEMKKINERYEVMRRFIFAISERLGFDFEMFDELVNIAEGTDDPAVMAFLESIMPNGYVRLDEDAE